MLWLCIFCIALISYTKTVQGEEDLMPQQTFMCSNENFNRIASENVALKAMNEDLKMRLELQQVSYEQKLMKMQILINETKNAVNPQALVEMSKLLVEPILKKLDTLANSNKNQENFLKNNLANRFSSCAEALMKTHQNGIYNISLRNYRIPFPVYCDDNGFGGNLTVIQRRQDGSVDFYRNWTDYQKGFGDLNGEFFIGLDKLHAMTTAYPQELLIELEDFENNTAYAIYDAFAIAGKDAGYALNVLGSYSGNAGESLTYHKNMKFTTKDRDNDKDSSVNCAIRSKGGWWFEDCQHCHLNGVYSKNSEVEFQHGINWHHWKGTYYSLKSARMLIRPKNA